MKKLLSLSVIVFTATVMFGQDTTSTTTSKSQTGTRWDSVPPATHGDTSAMSRGKWSDSSKNRNWHDSSFNNNSANNNSGDTTGTGGANTNNDSSSLASKAEDKVLMINDKVYVVKSGDSTVLADSIRLGSGAVVKSNGQVTFRDGSTAQLKNGQQIALTPPASSNTTNSTSDNSSQNNSQSNNSTTQSDSSATTTTKTVAEDRVVMTNDRVYVVKNGDSTLLEGSIKLQSGAVVLPDGKVTFKNGSTTKLKNGQFIALTPAVEPEKTTTTTKKTTKSIKTTKTSATKKTPRSTKTSSH